MSRKTILVVGDPGVTGGLTGALRARGVVVLEADGAAEALEIARREAPAVLVTDVAIGPPGGIELVRIARAERGLEAACVVALSDLGASVLDQARESGAHAAFAPSVGPEAIADALADLVR